MDQNLWITEEKLKVIKSDTVGILIKNIKKNNEETSLSFREACNKIIHCNAMNFEYSNEKPSRGDSLKPIVHLYGELQNKEWKATLNINEFIEIGYQYNC